MSFFLYMLGLAILIGGIGWGLMVAGVATIYIVIGCLIVAGIGVMMAVSRTRSKDPPVG
jgi:hypothetical protein